MKSENIYTLYFSHYPSYFLLTILLEAIINTIFSTTGYFFLLQQLGLFAKLVFLARIR